MPTRISVKLPEELVAGLDTLVASGRFASRSALVRHGVEAVVAEAWRAAVDSAYRAGYEAAPETAAEIAGAERMAAASIAQELWERWW